MKCSVKLLVELEENLVPFLPMTSSLSGLGYSMAGSYYQQLPHFLKRRHENELKKFQS